MKEWNSRRAPLPRLSPQLMAGGNCVDMMYHACTVLSTSVAVPKCSLVLGGREELCVPMSIAQWLFGVTEHTNTEGTQENIGENWSS